MEKLHTIFATEVEEGKSECQGGQKVGLKGSRQDNTRNSFFRSKSNCKRASHYTHSYRVRWGGALTPGEE